MREGYEMVVGLEVHCELSTRTKLFCGCPNVFGAEPNTNICPVCLGLPGSLPVVNRKAVELAMRIGGALGCEIQPSVFHRKNYFYPDMPKDYQVSQYDEPINVRGRLELPDGSAVGIERAHMEEDTGKTIHVGTTGRIHGASRSLVDYNRAGVPLVEIVSAPDIRSAEQARAYVTELRGILVATGASDGRMEEGSLRVDANVSVRPAHSSTLGTRCEVKNLNSLRSLVRAIEYEATRQADLVDSGGTVSQETRHWDETAGVTHALRSKEEAYDYRYFQEPDLVPVVPDEELHKAAALPDPDRLPSARRGRLAAVFGRVDADDADGDALPQAAVRLSAEQLQTVIELDLDQLVVDAVAEGADPRLVLARAANEAAAKPDGARRLDARRFARLVNLEHSGVLSATQSKAVLGVLLEDPTEDPESVARRLGYEALDTSELDGLVDEVITAHPAEWERYAGGDEKVSGFLLGHIMRASSGRANGKLVAEALARRRSG